MPIESDGQFSWNILTGGRNLVKRPWQLVYATGCTREGGKISDRGGVRSRSVRTKKERELKLRGKAPY